MADVAAVLDALGWDRAWIIGHSWGGHLLLHCAVAIPERMLGGLAVDLLGGVGDGGEAGFEAELLRRTPPEAAARAQELDERGMRGEGTPRGDAREPSLLWPAYFAAPGHTMPFADARTSIPAYAGIWESAKALLPGLEASLGRRGDAVRRRRRRREPDAESRTPLPRPPARSRARGSRSSTGPATSRGSSGRARSGRRSIG